MPYLITHPSYPTRPYVLHDEHTLELPGIRAYGWTVSPYYPSHHPAIMTVLAKEGKLHRPALGELWRKETVKRVKEEEQAVKEREKTKENVGEGKKGFGEWAIGALFGGKGKKQGKRRGSGDGVNHLEDLQKSWGGEQT